VKLLAIDTTEEACSAALYLDGEVRARYELAPRRHSVLILPMMDELLAEAGLRLMQLDGLAFGRGPGSFTGVRIAAAVIQGAAFGADLPVAPVSTLRAVAQRARREAGAARVLASFDARMGEIYWGPCVADESGLMQSVDAERVLPPSAVPLPDAGEWIGAGSGWATYARALGDRLAGRVVQCLPDLQVHAQDVAVLGAAMLAAGQGVAAEQALPVYLRDEVAWNKVGSR
jgi:tRNA threonylcarbamoyladenosine biosynthesis protein TsaB